MSDTKIPASSTETGIDLGRALTFVFDDPEWIPKVLVGTLFAALVPFMVGMVFIAGYAVLVARQAMRQASPLMPEWDDLPAIFIDGLKGLAISLSHKLPVILLGILLVLAVVGGLLLGREGDSIPDALLYYGLPTIFGGFLIVLVLSLALMFYVPAAFVRFIQTDRLGPAFDVMENIAFIRENSTTYLSGVLAIVLAGFISQLGFLVFCIGMFPAMFWSACVMGYVVGELARRDTSSGRLARASME